MAIFQKKKPIKPVPESLYSVSILDFIGAKDDGAIRRAKFQSNCHHQQTDTQLLTGRMPFPSPNHSIEGKNTHDTANYYLLSSTAAAFMQLWTVCERCSSKLIQWRNQTKKTKHKIKFWNSNCFKDYNGKWHHTIFWVRQFPHLTFTFRRNFHFPHRLSAAVSRLSSFWLCCPLQYKKSFNFSKFAKKPMTYTLTTDWLTVINCDYNSLIIKFFLL